MAGPRTCRNFAFIGEDKLAKSVLTKDSNTLIPYAPIFSAQTTTPAQIPAPAWALTPAPGLPSIYIDINFKTATRLALKSFVKSEKHGKRNFAPWDRVFKARNYELYYDSSHMECYYFCQ